jgi:hypothetical protein
VSYTLDTGVLPASQPLVAALDREWSRFGQPGTWWSGNERVAIAGAARAARSCRLCSERRGALSPTSVDGRHDGDGSLPAPVVDAVHRIATDPGRLSATWYQTLIAAGVTPEQLVELAGVLGILTLGDSLARAYDTPPAPLPTPSPGEPSRQRPEGAVVDEAWVPMIPAERAEGPVAVFYEQVRRAAGFVFNVSRALTVVPAELAGFFGVFLQSYATHGPPPPGGLDRPQMELLAAATSSLNDCFY